MLAWIIANKIAIIGFMMWSISELIAFNPKMASNSLIQLIMNVLKSLKGDAK